MASSSSSRPRSGLDLPTDITDYICDMLLEQRSLTYDEQDIARDASKCMMVGNPAFTTIGCTLYKAISPRLGQDTGGLTEKSSVNDMKALLKAWKLPLAGAKPQLWQRIKDQVSVPEDCNDQLCPCSAGTRNLVKELSEAEVSQSRAKDMFLLSKFDLERNDIRCEPHYSNSGMITYNYALKDIKALCIKRYGGWRGVQASKDRTRERREDWDRENQKWESTMTEALQSRGIDMAEGSVGQKCLKRLWFLKYEGRRGDPADFTRAVDTVHAHYWFVTACIGIYSESLFEAKATFKPKKQSQYKMGIETDNHAKKLALQTWVSMQTGSLDTLLADPMLPSCLHAGVREAWRKVKG